MPAANRSVGIQHFELIQNTGTRHPNSWEKLEVILYCMWVQIRTGRFSRSPLYATRKRSSRLGLVCGFSFIHIRDGLRPEREGKVGKRDRERDKREKEVVDVRMFGQF